MNRLNSLRRALKSGLKLTVAVTLGWLAAAVLASLLSSQDALAELTIAAALCLIPGWLVFVFHSQYRTAAPLAMFLMATAGRMAAVLIGALTVTAVRPDLDTKAFALALGAFYVLSLAIETKLLSTSPAGSTFTDD